MDSKKYYVYEWYLNDGRVFYVGKGCGDRYKHILDEIKNQVKPQTYNKIEQLYIQFRQKIR